MFDNVENLEEILEADARFDFTFSVTNIRMHFSFIYDIFRIKYVSTRWNNTLEILASLLKNKSKLSMLRHVKFVYSNLNIGKIVNLSFYKQLYPKYFLSIVYFLNIFFI